MPLPKALVESVEGLVACLLAGIDHRTHTRVLCCCSPVSVDLDRPNKLAVQRMYRDALQGWIELLELEVEAMFASRMELRVPFIVARVVG